MLIQARNTIQSNSILQRNFIHRPPRHPRMHHNPINNASSKPSPLQPSQIPQSLLPNPPSLHTKPIIPFPQRLTAITTPNPLFPNLIFLISFFGLAEGPNEWGGVDEVCRGGGDIYSCATELWERIGGDFEGVGEAEEGFCLHTVELDG